MKKVRTLLRVSSKQQLHGDDIPMQRSETRKFIESHTDWEFDYEYIEKAVSGFKKSICDREVLLKIQQDAKEKKFDVLVVYMSDRIGRKEDETPAYVVNLNSLGIEVWSVKEGQLKTDEHIDLLTNFIRFWQAGGESRKTGIRVRDAQKDMVKSGKFVGGKAPYGYELVLSGEISNHGRALKQLVIVEDDAKIVREIFRMAAVEGYGAFKIAKLLNERGLKTKKGGEWKACTISDMLKNPTYKGYLAYGRREQKNGYVSTPKDNWVYSEKQIEEIVIVSLELWEKAQQNREKRKVAIEQSKKNNGEYPITTTGKLPLMGLAYCGYCGTKLTNGSRYDTWTIADGTKVKKVCGRYKCTQKANASLLCEGSALYKQEEIEPIVFKVVGDYMEQLKQEDVYQDILKMQDEEKKIAKKAVDQLMKDINSIKIDIKTLKDRIPIAMRGEGVFTEEQISSILASKEDELQNIQAQLQIKNCEREEANINQNDLKCFGSLIPNWREEFDNSDVHTKKILLAKLIERIDVKKDEVKIKFKISMEEFLPLKTSGHEVSEQRL